MTPVIERGIYQHQNRNSERYLVLGTIPNATGYESTGQISPKMVQYMQLYDGEFPRGTMWVREERDFLGNTEGIPNFTLLRRVSRIEAAARRVLRR